MSYDNSKDWHKISREYKEEIGNLWNDMLTAYYDLKDSVDFEDIDLDDPVVDLDDVSLVGIKRVMELLKTSVESSEKAVFDIEQLS